MAAFFLISFFPLGCSVCSDVARDSEYRPLFFPGGILNLRHFLDAFTMKQRRIPESCR